MYALFAIIELYIISLIFNTYINNYHLKKQKLILIYQIYGTWDSGMEILKLCKSDV